MLGVFPDGEGVVLVHGFAVDQLADGGHDLLAVVLGQPQLSRFDAIGLALCFLLLGLHRLRPQLYPSLGILLDYLQVQLAGRGVERLGPADGKCVRLDLQLPLAEEERFGVGQLLHDLVHLPEFVLNSNLLKFVTHVLKTYLECSLLAHHLLLLHSHQ